MENDFARRTWPTITASIAYLGIVFSAAFLLGVVRILIIAPWLGAMLAVMVELPIVLAVSWVASRWAIQHYAVPDAITSRLAMGGLAFVMLMVLELGMSVFMFKKSVSMYLATFWTLPGATGLLGQIGFALIPCLQRQDIHCLLSKMGKLRAADKL